MELKIQLEHDEFQLHAELVRAIRVKGSSGYGTIGEYYYGKI